MPLHQRPAGIDSGFLTMSIFYQVGVVSPTPNPPPGGPGLCIYNPQRQGVQLYPQALKGKAVPLHAMEELGGRGDIAPTHSRPRH
jgi:hypothetical protein